MLGPVYVDRGDWIMLFLVYKLKKSEIKWNFNFTREIFKLKYVYVSVSTHVTVITISK